MAWVTCLQGLLEGAGSPEAEECAARYWNGMAWPSPEESLFETLCREARVLRAWGEDEEPDEAWIPPRPAPR